MDFLFFFFFFFSTVVSKKSIPIGHSHRSRAVLTGCCWLDFEGFFYFGDDFENGFQFFHLLLLRLW